jgi:hypothetical protein
VGPVVGVGGDKRGLAVVAWVVFEWCN